ncbi:MAG: insulinase family protein, partial [Sphingomonadales bacterium]
ISIFGDMDANETVDAVAATFGALKARPASKATPPPVKFPAHVTKPVVRTHTGKKDQAAAVIAWPTGGGSAGITESRKLEVLAAIFRDRLMDQLRSQAGISYSPAVVSQWPIGMASGGKMLALGMVPPDKTDFFFKLSRGIAADLVAKPVEADELDRALTPLKQLLMRQSSGNMFWMRLVEGGTQDPARIEAVNTLAQDLALTTPAEVQALAAKYLVPTKDWTMVVVPEKK